MSSPTPHAPHSPDVHLKRLHKACEIALHRLVTIATDSCNTAARLRALPVSKDKRLEIFLQKKREDEALEAYQKARSALLSVIDADPERVHSEDLDKSGSASSFGQPRPGVHRRGA